MDAEYDALEAAASSYKAAERDEEGRSHRSHHRERDDRERRHRHRDEGDDRHHSRGGENGHRDRDHDRDHRRGGRDEAYGGGGGGYGRERYDDRRGGGYDDGSRRRRRDDGDMAIAEPMHGGSGPPPPRDRRRYDEEPFAAPMRGYGDRPPPQRRRDDGDWRGGGGGGGGGGFRDGGRRDNRERRRSFDRRSPTPPGAVPLEDRQREMSLWDIRPHQFEGLGGMEAKRTGMFTYGPGRVPPPSHLGIPTGLIAGSFAPGIGTTQGTVAPARQTKRLYIGGITEQMTEEMLKEFFTKLMEEHKLLQEGEEGEVITEVQINLEKLYAFLEFRTAEEATAAMQFDGVMCEDVALKVKRPKDYIGIDPSLGSYIPGTSNGADSPNKLFIGGLPTYLNDEQVLELLKAFGELRSFNLVKETQGGVQVSKGFAFCEYLDPSITDMAIAGLHNFQLGDRSLVVQRAAVGRNTGIPSSVIPGSSGYLASAAPNIVSSASIEEVTSRCMLLLNMVEPDELYSDEDYNDILEDINEECSKYGEVEGVRVPRPVPKSKKWEPTDSAAATAAKAKEADDEAGVGRVFVLFREVESTKKAMKAIGGRQFAGRTILVASVSEEEFLGPAPPPPPPEDLDAAAADAVKDIMADLA